MRSILFTTALLTLPACQPASDKSDAGEAIARDAGVGDGPTGRSGRPVAPSAENVSIPANINKGVEPAPDANLTEGQDTDENIDGNLLLDPLLEEGS